MAIPKYDELYRDYLNALADGIPHSISEIREIISNARNLNEEDLQQMLPSGRVTVFMNRVSWAGFYLKKAGLITRVARGQYAITQEGKKLQKTDNIIINNDYLMRYPSFVAFSNGKNENKEPALAVETTPPNDASTPQDTIDTAFKKINSALADDLMDEIMKQSSSFFERLVVQLLLKMGYGGPFEEAGIVTRATGDGGIDGIIKEDKLGFSQIYIQAKRWEPNVTVNRPAIQTFSGALRDEGASKGLFITTARFSKGAIESAKRQHIVLVDGETLTRLMIEYDLGVSISHTYTIKSLDTDFFSEDSL